MENVVVDAVVEDQEEEVEIEAEIEVEIEVVVEEEDPVDVVNVELLVVVLPLQPTESFSIEKSLSSLLNDRLFIKRIRA